MQQLLFQETGDITSTFATIKAKLQQQFQGIRHATETDKLRATSTASTTGSSSIANVASTNIDDIVAMVTQQIKPKRCYLCQSADHLAYKCPLQSDSRQRKNTRPNPTAPTTTCFLCNKQGHRVRNCPFRSNVDKPIPEITTQKRTFYESANKLGDKMQPNNKKRKEYVVFKTPSGASSQRFEKYSTEHLNAAAALEEITEQISIAHAAASDMVESDDDDAVVEEIQVAEGAEQCWED
jgi:hypothetical protein